MFTGDKFVWMLKKLIWQYVLFILVYMHTASKLVAFFRLVFMKTQVLRSNFCTPFCTLKQILPSVKLRQAIINFLNDIAQITFRLSHCFDKQTEKKHNLGQA